MNFLSSFRLSILGYLLLAGICATVGIMTYRSFFASSTSPIAVDAAEARPSE